MRYASVDAGYIEIISPGQHPSDLLFEEVRGIVKQNNGNGVFLSLSRLVSPRIECVHKWPSQLRKKRRNDMNGIEMGLMRLLIRLSTKLINQHTEGATDS